MATRCLNKVQIIGNLTRDPELRYTPQGAAICTFGVATNRSWVNSDGEQNESVEFHQIVSWQKLAELCDQLLIKGSKVYLEGRLKTRRWTEDDGHKRSKTEIVINRMIVLDSKKSPEDYKDAEELEAEAAAEPDDGEIEDTEEKKEKKDKKEKKEKKEAKKKDKEKKDKSENEEVSVDDIPF